MAHANPTLSVDALAQVFSFFAEAECRNYAPLYERLTAGIAEDPALLELATAARAWPVPNVFLAVVHFLLLEGERHALAAYYPSVSGAAPPTDDPFPLFRQFCLEREEVIRRLLATRLTQTNEVGRCACWLPAFQYVAANAPDLPLAIVEVGASAGLNLFWDRYGYDYGTGHIYGNEASPVRVACEWRGAGLRALANPLPRIVYRLGLDLNPIDVTDPDEAMWLRALVWPEHQKRVETLQYAIELAARTPPALACGDAIDLLPDVMAAVPADAVLCVYHSFTLNQFTEQERTDFADILTECSIDRPVYRLGFEGEEPGCAILRLHTYERAVATSQRLARCQPHGQWIEWEAGAS